MRDDAYKLELVRRFAPGRRLLEVGAGTGGFALLSRDAGYEVETIEIDDECRRFLEDVVGVPAHPGGGAEAVASRGGPYDAVAFWHVLEHLEEPYETLAAAASVLGEDGVVLVAAPNPEAIQLAVFGSRWAHVDAPRHLQLVPVKALADHAAALGLQLVYATTDDPGARGWNTFGWRESLAGTFRQRGLKRLARGVGAGLARVLVPLERREGRGSTYTVVLRRERPA